MTYDAADFKEFMEVVYLIVRPGGLFDVFEACKRAGMQFPLDEDDKLRAWALESGDIEPLCVNIWKLTVRANAACILFRKQHPEKLLMIDETPRDSTIAAEIVTRMLRWDRLCVAGPLLTSEAVDNAIFEFQYAWKPTAGDVMKELHGATSTTIEALAVLQRIMRATLTAQLKEAGFGSASAIAKATNIEKNPMKEVGAADDGKF